MRQSYKELYNAEKDPDHPSKHHAPLTWKSQRISNILLLSYAGQTLQEEWEAISSRLLRAQSSIHGKPLHLLDAGALAAVTEKLQSAQTEFWRVVKGGDGRWGMLRMRCGRCTISGFCGRVRIIEMFAGGGRGGGCLVPWRGRFCWISSGVCFWRSWIGRGRRVVCGLSGR